MRMLILLPILLITNTLLVYWLNRKENKSNIIMAYTVGVLFGGAIVIASIIIL